MNHTEASAYEFMVELTRMEINGHRKRVKVMYDNEICNALVFMETKFIEMPRVDTYIIEYSGRVIMNNIHCQELTLEDVETILHMRHHNIIPTTSDFWDSLLSANTREQTPVFGIVPFLGCEKPAVIFENGVKLIDFHQFVVLIIGKRAWGIIRSMYDKAGTTILAKNATNSNVREELEGKLECS